MKFTDRKFIGNVNGVEYTNVEDFNKAIEKVVKSGDVGNLLISSYYKECNCDEDVCGCENKAVEEKDEKKPLDLNTILLNRESEKCGDGSYKVPSNVKELFDNASNKGEIEKELELKISVNKKELENSNNEITKFEHMLKEATNDRNEASHQLDYYNELLSVLNDTVNVKESKKEDNHKNTDDKQKVYATDSLKKNEQAYNIIVDVLNGFDKYLKDVGFWEK